MELLLLYVWEAVLWSISTTSDCVYNPKVLPTHIRVGVSLGVRMVFVCVCVCESVFLAVYDTYWSLIWFILARVVFSTCSIMAVQVYM